MAHHGTINFMRCYIGVSNLIVCIAEALYAYMCLLYIVLFSYRAGASSNELGWHVSINQLAINFINIS